MEKLDLLMTGVLGVFLATLVSGLVEAAKRLLKPLHLSSEWEDALYPALAILFGILAALLVLPIVNFPDQRLGMMVLAGLVVGLVASGIWSQGSAYIRSLGQGKNTDVGDRLRTFVPRE